MKGLTKAFARTPHMLTSRVGMAKKSSDPVTDALVQRFTGIEDHVNKLVKDSTAFRDSVQMLMSSSNDFAHSFTTVFSPIGGESSYEFENKFPQAKLTIQHIGTYSLVFDELKETIRPEIELIESRVLAPCKELQDFVKKIRKTITKREHKLIDFDRHNNTYSKLRDKKDKSLSDEKNIFKVEQDYEAAASEYEHYNSLLQAELPRFFEYCTAFVTPLFHSFYYMQLNVFYMMLEKLNGFATEAGYDLVNAGDVESIYAQKQGNAAEELAGLSMTKRGMSTAQIMSIARANNPGGASSSSSLRSKAPSISSGSRFTPPASNSPSGSTLGANRTVAAPPPYTRTTSTASTSSVNGGKRAPPPPPALKPRPSTGPKPTFVTALYDFQAQNDGDLSFQVGDRIEIVERSDPNAWWRGRLNGLEGVFPGNYVQVD